MDYGLQALKLVAGLLILTLTFRLLGKKNLAQLSPFDMVHVIVFGGILDSVFYDDEIGLLPFVFSAAVWSISIYTIEMLAKKSNLFRIIFRGTPDHIIENGKLNMRLFEKSKIEMGELRSILRQKGIFSLRQVKELFLEPDGKFSVIRYPEEEVSSKVESYNVLLVEEGEILHRALRYVDKTAEWLRNEMSGLGVSDLRTVVYCEWSETDGFYYITEDDCIYTIRKGHLN